MTDRVAPEELVKASTPVPGLIPPPNIELMRRAAQYITRLEGALRQIDPTWLDKLALWLDEDDRLMREHLELGNFVNRETGEPMDPETQRRMIEHRSDDGTQQRLRSYADLIRTLLSNSTKEGT